MIIVFKGKIKAVTGLLSVLANKYDGWTVADYIWIANLNKRINDANKKKKF